MNDSEGFPKAKIRTTNKIYTIQRQTFREWFNWMGHSLLRPTHSITINKSKMKGIGNIYVALYIHGMSNKLLSKTSQIYFHACPMLSALKIIHPNTAKKKVKSICPVSLNVGKIRPSATWLVYFRFLPVRIRGRNKIA